MSALPIVAVVLCVILAKVFTTRRRKHWPDSLQRLHAGVTQKAEWMASDETVNAVERDYLAAQYWMAESLLAGYVYFLREAPLYLSGKLLKDQQKHVQQHLQRRGPRLVGILRAHHEIRVRHFSDDGLTCYVVDQQKEQRMATYDYWQHQRIHTQDLTEGAYVYRMVFDRAAHRWKIDEFIQQMPLGWCASSTNHPIRLQESLPAVSGRDI